MDNFSVESKGYCFLCLNKIPTNYAPVKLNKILGNDKLSSVHSFQDISRYLKIDMRKVFIQGGPVPPHLLTKVEKSRLKVEMCAECASVTENISRQCRQLEKLKMEIESGLESVHRKMMKADETGQTEHFRRVAGFKQSLVGGWIEILEVLRMETMQKCSSKINKTSPRLQVQRLTADEIQRRTFRIPKKDEEVSESKGMSESRIIKLGEPNTVVDWTLDEDFDHCENPFGKDLDCNTGDTIVQDENVTAQGEVTSCKVTRKNEIEIEKNPRQKYKINPKTKMHNCLLCSLEYASRVGANEHYNKVHRRIRFKCKICGNEFTERNSYKVHHQNVHMGVRFQCTTCKKVFSQKNNLRRHQRKAGCASGVGDI